MQQVSKRLEPPERRLAGLGSGSRTFGRGSLVFGRGSHVFGRGSQFT